MPRRPWKHARYASCPIGRVRSAVLESPSIQEEPEGLAPSPPAKTSWAEDPEMLELLAEQMKERRGEDDEFSFHCLSDYGFDVVDLFSEEGLEIRSLPSREDDDVDDDDREKTIFDLDSDEEKEFLSSSEDEAVSPLPTYADTEIVYPDQPTIFHGSDEKCNGAIIAKKNEDIIQEPLKKTDEAVDSKKNLPTILYKPRVSFGDLPPIRSAANVDDRLVQMGVKHPEEVSACLKKAVLNGFVVLKGVESLLAVVCGGRCVANHCRNFIRVRLLDVLRQSDFSGSNRRFGARSNDLSLDPPGASVICDSPECGAALYVTNMCTGHPRLVSADHHHCVDCPNLGCCVDDSDFRHCSVCGQHFYAVVDQAAEPGQLAKTTCSKCSLSEAQVCDFVNSLVDDRHLDPFELRLCGPDQLNPCVLAAIQFRLVQFPRLPTKRARKMRKKIFKRGDVVILSKDAPIEDHVKKLSLGKELQNCVAFTGTCFVCSYPLSITWGRCLFLDYDELLPNADADIYPVVCKMKNCLRPNYLINACKGRPKFVDFKSSRRHCTSCPGFGWCSNESSLTHCARCHLHFSRRRRRPRVGRASRTCDGICPECAHAQFKSKDVSLTDEEKAELRAEAKAERARHEAEGVVSRFIEDNSFLEKLGAEQCQTQ